MGIRFLCPACGKKINVKDHQAGLRGFCPKCNGRIEIPLRSTLGEGADDSDTPRGAPQAVGPATANAAPNGGGQPSSPLPVGRLLAVSMMPPAVDPLAEQPALSWYVAAPGAPQPQGPLTADAVAAWLQQGLLAATALVWRQDWPDWRAASVVWPHLATIPAPPTPIPQAVPIPAGFGAAAAGAVSIGGATSIGGGVPIGGVPSAAGSAPRGAEIYYPRRKSGSYTNLIAFLVGLAISLGVVAYLVITRKIPTITF